jgi:PAS domain-containing protein
LLPLNAEKSLLLHPATLAPFVLWTCETIFPSSIFLQEVIIGLSASRWYRDGMAPTEASRWLYSEAPFAILAHNTAADPVFVYGNEAAQRLFEYEWDELTTLPSRLSAEAPERGERQQFLDRVGRDGFVEGYSGIRVTKSGKRFRIENATVWQLIDVDGTCRGQAAMLR